MLPDFPHHLTPLDLAALRHSRVEKFLSSRGLSPDWLTAIMKDQVGDGLLMLTSSPVHGLANATSDFDFIRIQPEPIGGPRISTKIFEQGHHLEVVSFSEAEVTANLAELRRLAAAPFGTTVDGFRSWDKTREPRRKQTERIVNGITLDGSAPFLDALPSLSTVWARAALQTAAEQTAHLVLAERAGETRGRVGYAFNVLLHLMDALLSHHGDVYTTRKWYVLRWARMVRDGGWRTPAARRAAETLEGLRTDVAAALSPEAAGRPLGPAYQALLRDVLEAVGHQGRIAVTLEPAPGGPAPFLPGASMLVSAESAVLLPGRDHTRPLPLTAPGAELPDLAGLAPEDAAVVLRAVRAGAARLTVVPES
ncbi:DUF6001 family protein [Streptomyces sp. SID10853]|uniref:DUF6001 family protein n=1 Tax=Streptomyces sp. SID10853 TaxID=2706028 RepID=UPI00194269DC|nr:DUF6001 family protein [Streptomyces sp. SID10853]